MKHGENSSRSAEQTVWSGVMVLVSRSQRVIEQRFGVPLVLPGCAWRPR